MKCDFRISKPEMLHFLSRPRSCASRASADSNYIYSVFVIELANRCERFNCTYAKIFWMRMSHYLNFLTRSSEIVICGKEAKKKQSRLSFHSRWCFHSISPQQHSHYQIWQLLRNTSFNEARSSRLRRTTATALILRRNVNKIHCYCGVSGAVGVISISPARKEIHSAISNRTFEISRHCILSSSLVWFISFMG